MLPTRITAKISKQGNGCWIWTGAKNDAGYGLTRYGNGAKYVHRVVYEAMVGPIPDDHQLDHLCRVRLCCQPEHLEPVTGGENTRRAAPAQRTECVHGHPYTPENTGRSKQGTRYCRRCHSLRTTARKAASRAARGPIPPKTHCVNGHEFDEANTYVDPDGHRHCRACRRQWMRDYYNSRKAS